jgi:hypothetical protein
MYQELCNKESDINAHLPTLRDLAKECNHITEMGVRYIVSTYGFAEGLKSGGTLLSIDNIHPASYGGNLDAIKQFCANKGINFEFRLGDTRQIEIGETDLLFIDTWHAYKQLKSELNIHHNKVKKYIILHDTTSYEYQDEKGYESLGDYFQPTGEGIWLAIEEFLQENKNWILHERFTNNNGLTILKKI